MAYGKELIMDLHNCDPKTLTRRSIREFLIALCKEIDMERCDLHFWDYLGDQEGYDAAPDHLKGTSVTQFITTSSITIHALDILQKVFINLFSCKDFDGSQVIQLSEQWFRGYCFHQKMIERY